MTCKKVVTYQMKFSEVENMANYDIKIKVDAGGVYSTDSNGYPLESIEQATKLAEELANEIYVKLDGRVTVEIESVKKV